MLLFGILLSTFASSNQVSDPNCLRVNPGTIDAKVNFWNSFDKYQDVTKEDISNQIGLISTRFERAHLLGDLNAARLKIIQEGISQFKNISDQNFQLYISSLPVDDTVEKSLRKVIQKYKKDNDVILKINSVNKNVSVGLYLGFYANQLLQGLAAVKYVFGSKEKSKFPIGYASQYCLLEFTTHSKMIDLYRTLHFLNCEIDLEMEPTPEKTAEEVVRKCYELKDTAIAINISAEIICTVRYASRDASPEEGLRSVLDFQKFWCTIVDFLSQNQSHLTIMMDSAFDVPPGDYALTGTNIIKGMFHTGWWRRRHLTSYEHDAFVEKVDELEGGREKRGCRAECEICSASKECCAEAVCKLDSTFQPFESQQQMLVCQSPNTSCVPRIPRPNIVGLDVQSTGSSSSETQSVFANPISIAVFILSLLLVVLLVVGLLLRRRRETNTLFTKEELIQFFEGSSNIVGSPFKSQLGNQGIVDDLAYDESLEVSEHGFEIYEDQLLGCGAFGVVMKARVGEEEVAVKTTLPGVNKIYLKALQSELKVLMYLGSHANIVNLVGSHTSQLHLGKLFLFLELCPLGNLLDFLRSHRQDFGVPEENDGYVERYDESSCTRKDMLQWSVQISSAMEHLAEKRVIHADIAARNILVFSKNLLKLTDFGLSRRLYEYSNYVKSNQEPMPWRHMSIEALRDSSFSVQSDVWSFGVTMWEIFSLGTVPYPGYSMCTDFVELLINGLRLECPQQAHPFIYEVMTSVWTKDVNLRPTIAFIHTKLISLLDELYTNQLYCNPVDLQWNPAY